jgi:hypothetical protein
VPYEVRSALRVESKWDGSDFLFPSMRFPLYRICCFLFLTLTGLTIAAGEKEGPRVFALAIGFGRNISGERSGEVRLVTNLHDSGDGSLREAWEKPGPAYIVFTERERS